MEADRKSIIEEKKEMLKSQMNKRKRMGRLAMSLAFLCIVVIPIALYMLPEDIALSEDRSFNALYSFVSVIYGMLFLLLPILKPSTEYTTELLEVENELDLLSIADSSLEERSEKLFKHHHIELKRYYDENLKQSAWIFVVGIACIIIGFGIIGITMYFLITNLSNELENKIIVASVGAIGAILSNFIAVIYLKMHSEAVKALTEFHNRFVNTHHFYFSNFLLSKIQNTDKREDALVELALKINGISPKAPAQGEESK
ncbi:hypothetical protein COJ79_10655 [Bacillus thuringiensis]|uniref:TRADD-N-associated membrane domain-containing protein n=1 Tax=Bacillus cereus group TaxID=86661 RepID=UPI000BF39A0B|nr:MULTISPECIES: hypothetical protein [Bacillus cereus group]MCC2363910.1 hypothetical protein [Bacillus cereus]PFO19256.1 hypothetical protein COJ79_10655 [Bacillus thuringiensis]